MAVELTERSAGLGPGVYVAQTDAPMREPGGVEPRYGQRDAEQLATWAPSEHAPGLAVKLIRYDDAATSSEAIRRIRSCAGEPTDDGGAAWRAAVERGRERVEGPAALAPAIGRAPGQVDFAADPAATAMTIERAYGRIEVRYPADTSSPERAANDELYAKVRGTIALQHGEPRSRADDALDALAASIVTSRGTNGCGIGWHPPEPALLVEAGHQLQRNPERLAEVRTVADDVERTFYPAVQSRELARTRGREREKDEQEQEPRHKEAHRLSVPEIEREDRRRELERRPGRRHPGDRSDEIMRLPPPAPPVGPEPQRELERDTGRYR